MSRPSGGNLRQLPSGRWQARYSDASGIRRKAPTTFTTKTEARRWVAETRADVLRGVHRTPDIGAVGLDDYLRRWLDQRTDLRAGTREIYRHSLDHWISRGVYLPAARGGRAVRINLGERLLNSLTVSDVREWYAAAPPPRWPRQRIEPSAVSAAVVLVQSATEPGVGRSILRERGRRPRAST